MDSHPREFAAIDLRLDDLMRSTQDGVEYGTDWIITAILGLYNWLEC